MENKNNSVIWWVVGIIVVVGLIIWIALSSQTAAVTGGETATTTDQSALQAPEGMEDISAGSVDAPATVGVKPVTLSYSQALKTYADRRIQLDASCAATPNAVTYKNNTNIMIDNRGPQVRTVKIGNTYTIAGYGFKIINLSLAKLPGTFYLDCGRGQNEATILIQK